VDDLIEGLVRLMDAPDDFTGPVNLGNPAEFTILDLAEQIIQLTGSRSKLRFLPLPSDDPTQRRPDIRLAKKRLRWEPSIAPNDGLLRTIAYFNRLLSEQMLKGNGEVETGHSPAVEPVPGLLKMPNAGATA
jgi:UDP-glucuronate decarboxylase